MQVKFTRWCIDATGRTPISVDPKRVDCVEWWGDAFTSPLGEFPASSRVIMKGKQIYVVQGSLDEVVFKLNAGERDELEG